jgi:uncharacterized protein (TIGR02996 family)
MSDEEAFLAALKANPADDTTRLVFADWLDDRDEPAKAQYLRAVVDLTRLAGGTAEYTEAAGRLYTAAVQTDSTWRDAAGARFDVVLERCGIACKIQAIKVIRELTHFGLAEAKAMAESVPTPLFSWLPYERAVPHLLAFHSGGCTPPNFDAAIRPTAWPDGPTQGAVFDVLLADFNPDAYLVDDYRTHSAIRGVAGLLGITVEDARDAITRLPLTLATGLRPTEVADFVLRVKRACNVYRVLPPGAIRVVPQLPTQEVSLRE